MPALFIREPVNTLTHLGAMFAAIPAAAFLLRMAWGDRVKFYGMLVYSCSLIFCFAASGLFHGVPEAYIEPFSLLDHIGIYALIAGTVTPIGLIMLNGRARVALVSGIWLMAAAGIGVRLCCEAPLSVRTGFYLVMGWIGCIGYFQLVQRLSHAKVVPMWLGGLFYSVGAAINLTWTSFPPELSILFGPHELFHVFVIAGAACHYYFMIAVLIPYRRLPAFTDDAGPPIHTTIPTLTNTGVRSGSAVNAETH
jgi:hemolysin III